MVLQKSVQAIGQRHGLQVIRSVVCGVLIGGVGWLAACTPPDPPQTNLPTSPAVLDITPAPTLDIDATATVLAGQLRPTPTPAGLYVVQSGDTLGSLAEEFNTTVDELLAANGMTDPNSLQAGQTLIIPSLLPAPGTDDTPAEAAENETQTISVTQTP